MKPLSPSVESKEIMLEIVSNGFKAAKAAL